MTKKEIYQALITGATVERNEHFIFKRNKLKRGCTYSYNIDGVKITERQFNAIYDELSSIKSNLLSVKKYKLTEFILTEFIDNSPF